MNIIRRTKSLAGVSLIKRRTALIGVPVLSGISSRKDC